MPQKKYTRFTSIAFLLGTVISLSFGANSPLLTRSGGPFEYGTIQRGSESFNATQQNLSLLQTNQQAKAQSAFFNTAQPDPLTLERHSINQQPREHQEESEICTKNCKQSCGAAAFGIVAFSAVAAPFIIMALQANGIIPCCCNCTPCFPG